MRSSHLGPEAPSSTVAPGEAGRVGSSGRCASHRPRSTLSPTSLTLPHPTGSASASEEPRAAAHPVSSVLTYWEQPQSSVSLPSVRHTGVLHAPLVD